MSNSFRFVDLFCGGGGSITGAINALNAAGIKYEGRGFNHWQTAIQTIKANHPEVVPDMGKACAPIESLLPDEIFSTDPERIDVVWASPSCTQHSRAKGGKFSRRIHFLWRGHGGEEADWKRGAAELGGSTLQGDSCSITEKWKWQTFA